MFPEVACVLLCWHLEVKGQKCGKTQTLWLTCHTSTHTEIKVSEMYYEEQNWWDGWEIVSTICGRHGRCEWCRKYAVTHRLVTINDCTIPCNLYISPLDTSDSPSNIQFASYSVAALPQAGSLSEVSRWKNQSHDTGELGLIESVCNTTIDGTVTL